MHLQDYKEKISIPPASNRRSVWLRVGMLIDGFSTKPRKDVHVVYDAKSIRYLGSARNPPPPKLLSPAHVRPDVELGDYIVLPGLIEAHAHLFLEGGELDFKKRNAHLKQAPQELLSAARKRLEKLVRMGIIAIRDAGDKHGVGLALSRLYESEDKPIMPYVDSPGAAIHHKDRYGEFMAEPIENHHSLKACLETRIRAGADRIKLIATEIIDFKESRITKEPPMTALEVTELVSAAKEFGKQTFAHASGDDGIERVIAGGVDSVEHGFFIRADQLAKMRDRQIAWIPTIAPVQKQVDYAEQLGWDECIISNLQKLLDQHATSLLKAHEMGVQIKPGYRSRFIITHHSPLKGIANLRKHKYIVCDGAVYDSDVNIDAKGL
jgi:imidazolonepropionase-like amidohydrolase